MAVRWMIRAAQRQCKGDSEHGGATVQVHVFTPLARPLYPLTLGVTVLEPSYRPIGFRSPPDVPPPRV